MCTADWITIDIAVKRTGALAGWAAYGSVSFTNVCRRPPVRHLAARPRTAQQLYQCDTASSPAFATTASCDDMPPLAPIAPITLPSTRIGNAPSDVAM